MKVILYMGVSVNGYIAKEDGDSEWTSKEDLQGFYDRSKAAGSIVMGKNTYRAALTYGYFPFPDALNVVVSHEPIQNTWGEERVLVTDKPPREVLALLEAKGFRAALLAGGGQLNGAFAREKLIDEIYLDVEPLAFGKGIKVFADADFELALKLLETKKLNSDTVQLHYHVLR